MKGIHMLIILIISILTLFLSFINEPFSKSYKNNSIISNSYKNNSIITLKTLIKGCAANETQIKALEKEQKPKIEVIDGKVIYSRAIKHMCCRKVKIKYRIYNSTIYLYEVWSGIGCKCICFSYIKAVLSNIHGHYTINVYKKGTKPISNEPMKEELIISKNINI